MLSVDSDCPNIAHSHGFQTEVCQGNGNDITNYENCAVANSADQGILVNCPSFNPVYCIHCCESDSSCEYDPYGYVPVDYCRDLEVFPDFLVDHHTVGGLRSQLNARAWI